MGAVTYQELMCQTNTSYLLVLLHLVHSGQEAPGGGADEDGVVGAHVQHEGGVRDRNSVHSELGNGALADCSYSQTATNRNLKYQLLTTAQPGIKPAAFSPVKLCLIH